MSKKTRYAMIGSRKTPPDIKLLMIKLAYDRARRGCFRGSSGGAEEADEALELGVFQYLIETDQTDKAYEFMRIYLSKRKIKGRIAEKRSGFIYKESMTKALALAERFHPKWNYLNADQRNLMARNCFQILGIRLRAPVSEVVCWTPDGSLGDKTTSETGGTGQALRIAHANKVPILNLKNESHRRYVETLVRNVSLPYDLTISDLKQFRGYY